MAKKRKNGEGTLRQRTDGRWEGRIVIGYTEDGMPKTKSVTAKSKTECAEKLKKLKEECGKLIGKLPNHAKPEMEFGDWLKLWYETYSKPRIRPVTQHGYENRIYDHIIPGIGKILLNKLSQNDLQQFYASLKSGGRISHTDKFGEGLSDRLARYAGSEPTLEDVLGKTKTKRYAMSRLRRMVLCAYLGVTAKDIAAAPQYIRVLAANERGCGLLKTAQKTAKLPIVTKPASALSLGGGVSECFAREAKFTDLYVLARPESAVRTGGSEYRESPFILK